MAPSDPPAAGRDRHRASHSVSEQWSKGYRFTLTPSGSTDVRIDFHPAANRVTLLTQRRGPMPDLARWRNLRVEPRLLDGEDYYELRVHVTSPEIGAAYALITDTADGIQLKGQDLATALRTGIARYEALLGHMAGLSQEQELGLLGELTALNRMLQADSSALAAWVGPAREEGDFVFDVGTIECKSTSSERRTHIIAGLGQLWPPEGTALYLLSQQFTRATSSTGVSLVMAVDQARMLVGQSINDLDSRLAQAGWRDEDASLYPTHWRLRTTPQLYLVDETFPRLTTKHLEHVAHQERLSDITYRIDLTGLKPTTPPQELLAIVSTEDIS